MTEDSKTVTPEQLDLVVDIILNTERLDKISISFNPDTRTVTLTYEGLDDEWFNDLWLRGVL